MPLPWSPSMYELKKLSRVYPKGRGKVAALSNVDLDIPDGEFITVQGLTGHGKTTFLLMLGALDKPTSGKIIFDGKDLGAMPESQLVDVRAQNFGFIFQNYNLLPTLSAEENVGRMEKLWKERGMTLVLVTHDTKVARRAPRTAVITKGKLTLRDNRAPKVITQGPSKPSGSPKPA